MEGGGRREGGGKKRPSFLSLREAMAMADGLSMRDAERAQANSSEPSLFRWFFLHRFHETQKIGGGVQFFCQPGEVRPPTFLLTRKMR